MKVELTYFKKSGKYYSSGRYITKEVNMESIWTEVRKMIRMEDLPDLMKDPSDFVILVEVPEHRDNVKKLLNLDFGDGINAGDIKNSSVIIGHNNTVR